MPPRDGDAEAAAPLQRPPVQEKTRPPFYKDTYAFRHAINQNPIMGLFPKIRRTTQPTYGERIWLFILYMMTGLFLEHLSLLYGPICRRAYQDQCGMDDWTRNSTMVEDGGRKVPKTILEIKDSAKGLLGDNTIVKGLDDTAADVHQELDNSRTQLVSVLSGHIKLDCSLTMCDHWIEAFAKPREVDGVPITKAYKSFLLYPGLCRCNHTPLQKITYRIAVAVAAVIFQTALYKFFHAILSRDWENSTSTIKKKLNDCAMSMIDFVLFFELLSIFLIRFVPEAWVISLIASSVSVMTLSFMSSFFMAHIGLTRRFAELEDNPPPANQLNNDVYDDGDALDIE
mmetsp:Transcript_33779/g.97052  ORF Transcript_33779/g.97052 Transcript_33779/m.97052 type:complete len:342 (+) Transcript_33779:56-1081(+)|eukprot:CAMPEP_0176076904 /NCGR_PEP_ID=MMETSP0120_2-20121206/38450_1 /TAXON_ID=160619 /ORGANISM="Kryptoperidinium foliaceum, Strain CCMP 1326" /LENGTH=341 /DNA_ID=CAMNT_0017410633 /DNA_START=53 /DNA_END=1078 /DNA_ORIENTATION=-